MNKFTNYVLLYEQNKEFLNKRTQQLAHPLEVQHNINIWIANYMLHKLLFFMGIILSIFTSILVLFGSFLMVIEGGVQIIRGENILPNLIVLAVGIIISKFIATPMCYACYLMIRYVYPSDRSEKIYKHLTATGGITAGKITKIDPLYPHPIHYTYKNQYGRKLEGKYFTQTDHNLKADDEILVLHSSLIDIIL